MQRLNRIRFGAAVAALASSLPGGAALAAPTKVACVGEQTTHSDQLNRTVEYPATLQKALGATFDVQNFGDCCSTVLTGYPKQPETHPYLAGGSAPSFKESLTFAPDIVVIGSWGKHDTEIANSLYAGVLDATKFQSDYESLVTTYLNLPSKPAVFLSTPVPIPKGQPTGPTTTVILPAIEAIAAKYHLQIVPLYPAFLNQPQLYKDNTHVSDVAGLQLIADTVRAALTGTAAVVDGGTEVEGGLDDGGASPLEAGSPVPFDAGPIPGSDGGAETPAPGHPGTAFDSKSGCAMAPRSVTDSSGAFAIFGLLGVLVAGVRRRVGPPRRPVLAV